MGSGHVHPTAQPIHGCLAKGEAIFCHLELFPWPTGKQTDWHAFIAHPIGESYMGKLEICKGIRLLCGKDLGT
jgi:hypothetical protein